MGRKEKGYHFIYKTTCNVNNKFYIGMHSTDNLEDGYIGSGKRLWYSIKKYGRENFTFEILEHYPNRKELIEREKEIINEDFIKDDLCLNLKPGGTGGFCNEEHRIKFLSMGTNSPNRLKRSHETLRKRLSDDEYKENYSNKIKNRLKEINFNHNTFSGKNHNDKSKEKIGLKNSLNQKGEKNSQYGSRWISNGKENKKIKKETTIPEGWFLGRIKIL